MRLKQRVLAVVAVAILLSACTPAQIKAFETFTGHTLSVQDSRIASELPDQPYVLGDTTFYPDGTTATFGRSGCHFVKQALIDAGATPQEVSEGVRIARRESYCTLYAHAFSVRTKDDSWGPWQINYWGSMRESRIEAFGPPESNTWDWETAARNFLKMAREMGWCHWRQPNYCA